MTDYERFSRKESTHSLFWVKVIVKYNWTLSLNSTNMLHDQAPLCRLQKGLQLNFEPDAQAQEQQLAFG